MKKGADKSIDTNQLPQKETFSQKEIYQNPQPADWGKAINRNKDKTATAGKEKNKSSKKEGLNEKASKGNAGAFEGLEDQSNNLNH